MSFYYTRAIIKMMKGNENNKYRIIYLTIFLVIIALFCYFRLKPIFFEAVPYTYDQGRDFLKAQEIVLYNNLTFIGPTTGIMGVYHGAWWYYFLSSVFFIFNGWPTGFYLGIFSLMFASTLLFFFFMKREFGFTYALLFLLITSVSSYFIGISFFPGNNILVPPLILMFLFALYKFFKTDKLKFLFLLALSLGFIFEAEVSFGMFLIPSFLLIALFFKEFRKTAKSIKKLSYFLLGIMLPFLPRIFFEMKNNFNQIKAIAGFIGNPSNEAGIKSLREVFFERLGLFSRYITEIFYGSNGWLAIMAIMVILACVAITIKRKKATAVNRTIIFLTVLFLTIFTVTLFYRNNFFWVNYLEGIHYVFLFVLILSLLELRKYKPFRYLALGIIALYLFINFYVFTKEITSNKKVPFEGLHADVTTTGYLVKENPDKNWCLRIYTPPIVPYTYNYLINYYSRKNYIKQPSENFTENKCWYIIDKDSFDFRVEEWRKNNIPENAKLKKTKIMGNETKIELWELK